jgi:hypothetical protein
MNKVINLGNGQVDVSIIVGIGGERQFRAGFTMPGDLVKKSLNDGRFSDILTSQISREVEKITALTIAPSKKHLTLMPEGLSAGAQPEGQKMTPTTAKLECIKTLISKGNYYSEIVEFLAKTESVPRHILNQLMAPDPALKAKMLFDAIERAHSFKALSMLHYSWTILPKERIQIEMVSLMDHKTFTYEEP